MDHPEILRGKNRILVAVKKIKEMSYDQFLRFIFPEGMFDYFELSDFKEKSDRVEIYFEEKNIHPQEYATNNLESKGFYEQVRMQDYPMRGRSCLLFIKKTKMVQSQYWQICKPQLEISGRRNANND